MKQSINFTQFNDAFHNMGRGEQFSYNGLIALYDYIAELEDDTGTEWELDVIAICCEFSEYESFEELQDNYSDITSFDELNDYTCIIKIDDDSFIIQNF